MHVGEAGAIGREHGIGDAHAVQAQRTRAEARAGGQAVDHLHRGECAALARVLQRERVLHEIARGGDLLTRGLAQLQRVAGGVERHVDRDGRRRGDHERLAERTRLQAIRRIRQRLQIGDRALRGKRVAAGRQHFEAIVARRDQRETEHARRQAVLRAALVGDRLAGDHFAGIAAHAVVAEHRGRQAGGDVDQAHARAVDRRTGLRIEHEAERIDQRIGLRRIGVVRRVDVGGIELGVALDLQRAVGAGRAGGGRDVADEHAGVRAGLRQAQHFGVAGRGHGHAHVDGLDHIAVAVAVEVDHAHEDRITGVRDAGVLHGNRLRRVEGACALRRRRRQGEKAAGRTTLRRARGIAARACRFVARERDRGARRQRLHGKLDFVGDRRARRAGTELVSDASDVANHRSRRRDLRHGNIAQQ